MHAWLIAALVVSWVLVAALAGLLFVLVKQHGELIMYQQDLNHRLELGGYLTGREVEGELRDKAAADAQPDFSGLPLGSEAPAFALPDLEGRERSVEDYRGAPFVLGFFNTDCGYCKDLSPKLGKLPKKSHRLVLLSHGPIEAHQELAAKDNWRCDVVVEDEWHIAGEYMAAGTPSGYLIDAEGRIASPLALGGDNLMSLLEAEPIAPPEPGESGNGHVDPSSIRVGDPIDGGVSQPGAMATALKTRDVSESRIQRDGLEAGTVAPSFTLPDLKGKSHSLLDYRGKRVLLVFSDVTCGPCEQMAPELVKLYEQRRPDDLEIVMISRGDLEENKRKAKAFGYPFPVLLQRSWEVSKEYAMFATPIAYLVDADGIIVRDVALGPEAILALGA
jgi:peroxiredoxin